MKIEFFGVRGSVPSPRKDTVEFGGNTSCVYVETNAGDSIILDSGTGIIALGAKLAKQRNDLNILLTHNHWDHIQGFPYFQPIFQANRNITIIPGEVDYDDKNLILKQMSGSAHPVKFNQLPANIRLNTQLSKKKRFSIANVEVATQKLNHPDGGTAYCLYADNKKLAYITDNELIPPGESKTSWQEWIMFAENADVLIHDAQYTGDDLPSKHGWGHSTFMQVAELAVQANVKRLYFISHDPSRNDEQLLFQEQQMQRKYGQHLFIECSREGQVIDLGGV